MRVRVGVHAGACLCHNACVKKEEDGDRKGESAIQSMTQSIVCLRTGNSFIDTISGQ